MQNLFIIKPNKIFFSNIRYLSSKEEKRSIISLIRYVLNHYWIGSKLLYQNYKTVRQIRTKDVNYLTFTDRSMLEQFNYDKCVGIPFVLLFSIPIIGYSAPLIALIAPKYLPSTLITPKQKVKFLEDDAFKSSLIIDSLIKHSKYQYDSEQIHNFISILQKVTEISNKDDRFELIISSINNIYLLFNKYVNLSLIDRKYLLLIHQSIFHSSYISKYLLNNYSIIKQIENWQNRIYIDDKILMKNLNKLNPYELVLSLYSRGIYLHLNEMGKVLKLEQINKFNKIQNKNLNFIDIDQNILNDWKQILLKWIQIHDYISNRNHLSTSFLVHLAPLLIYNKRDCFY